jgi:putative FmdB family regulatory protein
MPLYEYKCDACGHRFEVIQKFSDPLVDTCPKCKGTVRKLFSSPAIQFKGSGFYITDYPKADHQSAAKADSAQSDKPAKTEAKSDTSAKAATSTKTDKPSGDTSSSGASSTPAPSTSSSSTKSESKE